MTFLNSEGASSSSSSSSSTRRWNCDVFLSFRGEDPREGFTSHLYEALCDKGINTFIDDKLHRGEGISKELIQVIKSSLILVIVFFENHADSIWCLDEFAEIVECNEKDQEVQIRPVFYHVDPSEIRNQKGNFGKALAKHEKKLKDNKDKVQRWRDALRKAANGSGWHYKKGCTTSEYDFIQNIVEEIADANRTQLYVAEYPVGINYCVEAIESLLDVGLDEFCVVGIYGLPGVGKTTIAKAVYNKIAKHFDGSSFLMNVRGNLGTDAGIITLQEQLLNDILGDGNWKVGNRFRGMSLIEKRLCCKKFFLILDDVDDSTRIENLLGKFNWFAPGSRVIITLRDRHWLAALKEKVCTTYKVKEFKVEQLNKHEALQLFKEHAFPGNKPLDEDYSKLATKFIHFAKGLPLALEIIARDLCGKAKDEWESALDMYKKIPNKDIQKILRVSYDGLNDTEKDIFLDIACFFKGWYKDYVVKILNACELYPRSGIPRLVDKFLITVDRYGRLSMHDLIQQMGREVVRQQAPDILEKRSRLYCYKDSLEVLTRNKGSKKIRGIMLHSPQPVEVQLHTEAFKRMENLKFLIVENVHICEPLEFLPNNLILLKWPDYPFHWPSKYFPEQLVAVEMPRNCIRLPKLINQEYRLENLKDVNLKRCEFITKLPKLWAPNLENLDLSFCKNLVKIDECFGSLEKLKRWNLAHCRKLQFLPSQLRLKSLKYFCLTSCSGLENLPNFHSEMGCLEILYLGESGIRELPSSIEHLTKLETLSLDKCENLRDLPDSIYKLQRLRILDTTTTKLRPTCNSIDISSGYGFVKMKPLDLLMKLDYFPALEMIDLSETNIVTIPESISRLPRLKSLLISNCKLLREIQGLPQSIRTVLAENCMLLDSQSPSGLLNQVIEIIGILPNRVCGSARSNKLMDPQFSNYLPSEAEGAEYEDGDISMDQQLSNYFPNETESVESEDGGRSMDPQFCNYFPYETEGVEYEHGDIALTLYVPGTEIPKWFNHQSVENSILFWVGCKFAKLAVCIALGPDEAHKRFYDCYVYISINGCEEREYGYFRPSENNYNHLFLFSPCQWLLQQHLIESNPTDQNCVEVTYRTCFAHYDVEPNPCIEPLNPTLIKRWGVHVECTCPSPESVIPNLPLLTAGRDDDDIVDYWGELTYYGSDDKEEYQSPLVLDDTSMSCMSWLVEPTTMLFKLFCFCSPRNIS
ncbi:hypothetical protein ACB092_03G219400 [Castanea dentata]